MGVEGGEDGGLEEEEKKIDEILEGRQAEI